MGIAASLVAWGLLAGLNEAGAGASPPPQPYQIIGKGIPVPLTKTQGRAEKGRALVASRAGGNCLACHAAPIPEEPDHGRVGPSLVGVGTRLSEAEIRLRIVDPKINNPNSMMPAFFRAEGLNRVADPFQGQTILSAQDVEDIVAYLKTLT